MYKEFELETNPLAEAESSCIWLGSAKGQARDTRRAQVFADHELRGATQWDWNCCPLIGVFASAPLTPDLHQPFHFVEIIAGACKN